MSKKTLILGASTDETRYSNIAAHRLLASGHEIVLVGNKKGTVEGLPIHNDSPIFAHIDTVTLYLNPQRQKEYYEYILEVLPKRIIFNPGTENEELVALANAKGIATENACTLVLLSMGEY
jgi:predicted CoA-binding protein